jgi:hypothetical protein
MILEVQDLSMLALLFLKDNYNMKDKSKRFDKKKWKTRLTHLLKEHPELNPLPNKIGIYSNGEHVCKVKLEDKEI